MHKKEKNKNKTKQKPEGEGGKLVLYRETQNRGERVELNERMVATAQAGKLKACYSFIYIYKYLYLIQELN